MHEPLQVTTELSERRTRDAERLGQMLLQARAGDAVASDELYREIMPFTARLAYWSGVPDPEALCQETLIRFIEKAVHNPKFVPTNVKGWLRRTVENQVHDIYKSPRSVPMKSLDQAFTEEDIVPQDVMDAVAQHTLPDPAEIVINTLDVERITLSCRQYIAQDQERGVNKIRVQAFLLQLQGYSYQEISDTLNLPLGTVKSHINRAKTAIRNIVLAAGGVN